MTRNVTRRDFVAGSAATAGLLGLAACGNTESTDTAADVAAASGFEAPAADAYPIDPDGADVEALWTSEETRDGWTRIINPEGGPELGVADPSKIIQVNGLAFKDLNGSGKLDLYEDWRQDSATRAATLAASMPAEDCIKLMWHGGASDTSATQGPDVKVDANDVSAVDRGSRAGVSRLSSTIETFASDVAWINIVQTAAEKSLYGIPYLNSTDPYSLYNIPQPCSLSSVMDKDIWRKAGMWMGRAWRATGVSCNLGPQIDVYSTPIGCRIAGSVSEDPALNRDFTQAFAGGMQSTWGDDEATDDLGWGKDSVATMLKHFVGEGSVEGGRNDHADPGKWNVFPGGNFEAHLVPFLDGGMNLDSKTGEMAAIMPCYGIAYDPNDPEALGEPVGSSYSEALMGLLRSTGWDGMICTDWQILTSQIWGVEDETEQERYARFIRNTVDQHGGSFDPDGTGMPAYQMIADELGEDEALRRVQESARRITNVMFNLGLFEQPFSDRSAAKAILENETANAFGIEVTEKCIVMLKNDGTISADGLGDKPKVYIPQKLIEGSFWMNTPATVELGLNEELANQYFDVVTDNVGEPSSEDGGYTVADITRAGKDELADCQYAIVCIKDPQDANTGTKGGVSMFGEDSGEPLEYLPITRQYRPYTADGKNVRKESLNGPDCKGEYENRSYFGKSTTATNESDLDLVINTKKALPEGAKLICFVQCKNPMVFSELESSCDVILLFQGESAPNTQALLNIVTGATEPSGLLAFQQPKDMDTVEASFEDVPRDLDCYVDSAGNAYDFCFGLNWSGVIDDERVATYKVAPLTKVETAFEWPQA